MSNSFKAGPVEIEWDDTVDDAREVLDKLKAEKTRLSADKRELAAQIADLRAEYRERVAHRIPVRGGRGLFGTMLRANRAAHRAGSNDAIRPLEEQKSAIEGALVGIDRANAHLKAWIEARGGTVRASAAKPAKAVPKDDPLAAIDKLATLRDRGAITQQEYDTKKAELLARL